MKNLIPKTITAVALAAVLSTASPAIKAAPSTASPTNIASVIPNNTIRLQGSAEITDYSDTIKAALSTLIEQGGGTLIIPQGQWPMDKGIEFPVGDKVANIAIRGEKGANGRMPVVYAPNPKHAPLFFFFTGDIKNPGLSVWFSDFEIKGNNVPVDFSKGGEPFQLDEGQTDTEPNKNLPEGKTYGGHPFFFHQSTAGGIRAHNIKTMHVNNMILRDVFGNGILLANYGWQLPETDFGLKGNTRLDAPSVTNSKLLNVWQWHESDNTGDAVMFMGAKGGLVENCEIVNDLKYTRWIGRIGVVLENATSDVLIKNNTIAGYGRNIHIENTFGGHRIVGNKFLATVGWYYMIQPYVKSNQIFDCPSRESTIPHYNGARWWYDETFSYGKNATMVTDNTLIALASIQKPAATIMVGDSGNPRMVPEGFVGTNNGDATWGDLSYNTGANLTARYRHLETVNMLFFDGHVKAMKKGQVEEKVATEDGTALTGDNQFVLWNWY